ncbi:MAG TPA: hypothetical protein PLZ32_10580 [Saprospiraceae bacterium]|nr:hypothetical protein [Saprospiraceae bacterium]
MEDYQSASTIISTIIGEKVDSLVSKPQESVVESNKYGLSILRFDFIGIITNSDGVKRKVIIEMQKAQGPSDIRRFRRYLGENYSKQDFDDETPIDLPIICIYFIGFPVNLPNAIVSNKKGFYDILTNSKIAVNLPIMELLSHETYFIFIDNLDETIKSNSIFVVLDIFNQKNIVGKDCKWLIQRDDFEHIDNENLKHLMMRLHNATMEEELLEQAKKEDDFTKDLDREFRKFQLLLENEISLKEEEKRQKEEERRQNILLLQKIEELSKTIEALKKK